MKFRNFFLLLWVIFALLDLDPDSDYKSVSGYGSTDLIEFGSKTVPECKFLIFGKDLSDLIFFNLLQPPPSLPTVTLYVASFGLRLCLQGYQLGFQSWRRFSGWVSENLTLNSTNRKPSVFFLYCTNVAQDHSKAMWTGLLESRRQKLSFVFHWILLVL